MKLDFLDNEAATDRPLRSNRNMEFLRINVDPEVTTKSLNAGLLSAHRIARPVRGHGMTDAHAEEDAFLLSYQTKDYQGELWLDGRKLDFKGSQSGNFTLYDYSRTWRADIQSPFDCVNFHISRAALRSLEDDLSIKKLESFNIAPGTDVADPVMRAIVEAVLPIFDGIGETSQLVLDYIGTGLIVHLASTHGGARSVQNQNRGGLTPFQVARATALLDANLNGRLTLADFSRECMLSSSYFAKAFKVTMGMTLFRWIAIRRIEKAVELLKSPSIPLAEVGVRCGFADQAHFTRVFRDAKGITPAAWRRERQSKFFRLSDPGL